MNSKNLFISKNQNLNRQFSNQDEESHQSIQNEDEFDDILMEQEKFFKSSQKSWSRIIGKCL